MIQLPRRSVTRFFIPLIDVLTLLFCIFLLMPLVRPAEESEEELAGSRPAVQPGTPLAARERQELERLRMERRPWQDVVRLQQARSDLERQVRRLQREKIATLEQRLAIRVLEIGEDGRLYYYDPGREKDRRVEITRDNVAQFLEAQKQAAKGHDLYFLLLYPRPAVGNPAFPLLRQREEYDRWFRDVAHGYDIPVSGEQQKSRKEDRNSKAAPRGSLSARTQGKP